MKGGLITLDIMNVQCTIEYAHDRVVNIACTKVSCDELVKVLKDTPMHTALGIVTSEIMAILVGKKALLDELQGVDVMYDEEAGECGWTTASGKSIVVKVGKGYPGKGSFAIVSRHDAKGGNISVGDEIENKFVSIGEMVRKLD
jgi:hypothetical protein